MFTLSSFVELLSNARENNYAIGAFNVYNLEGVRAVVEAAEALDSPAIIQPHPAATKFGGAALISICRTTAKESGVPMGFHLDDGSSSEEIRTAIASGFTSVMADASTKPFEENIRSVSSM